MTAPPNNTTPVPLLTIDELEKLDLSEQETINTFKREVFTRLLSLSHPIATERVRKNHVYISQSGQYIGHMPYFVTSIDDVLSLLPDKAHIDIRANQVRTAYRVRIEFDNIIETGEQSTRAAALTIAALRALEAGKR